MEMRIGSVPYLNVKPIVEWFHSPDCNADHEMIYAVPSELALLLRQKKVEVANVSIFEALRNPELVILPDISISSRGPVKSVRLFTKKPLMEIETLALDTSSLSSAALTHILLNEVYHCSPEFQKHPPDIHTMLQQCDAALIIGVLDEYDLPDGVVTYDLGELWQNYTSLPFVYACWVAREECASEAMAEIFLRAKEWGMAHLLEIIDTWSAKLELPLERVREYLTGAIYYDLQPDQKEGLRLFHHKCITNGLLTQVNPIRFYSP